MKIRVNDFGKLLLAAYTFMMLSVAQAGPYTDFPGSIPRAPGDRSAATDLVYNGQTLTPDEADGLRASRSLDLSSLNPAVSDVWSPGVKQNPVNVIDVQPAGENFDYLDVVQSRIGNFRFTVQKIDASGVARAYTILLSKNAHNVLLRKALLRRMGYQTPDARLLKSFTVKFNGTFSRNQFVKKVHDNAFGDVGRWILNENEADAVTVGLQDAIIVSSDNQIFDLTSGALTSEYVAGRRVLNSLLVPYNLVDVPESINLLTWHPGRIANDMIYLPYTAADELNPTFDDARWAAQLIAPLGRADFQAIVNEAQYPAPVAALLTEKLISRRNTLMSYFNIAAQVIGFNPSVSLGPALVNGKLIQTDYPGYGSRFAYGDPLAPLSATEIRSFAKSRVFGTLIDNAVSQFNTSIIPHTNLNDKAYAHQVGLAQSNFVNYLKTGQSGKTPFGMWTTPMFAGKLILSRDIVTGSYLGTDNLVQIADSFGFSVEGGLFVGVDGLPATLSVSAQAKLAFVRNYTHIKPIKSVKAALKEPFKNVVIPLLKKDFATTLEKVAGLGAADLTKPEIKKEITDAMTEFSTQLGVGESILITDSLSGLAALTAGYTIQKNIDAYAAFSASQVIVRRLQIYRKDDDTIQLYRDPADYSIIGASIGFDALIPVFSVRLQRKAGSATTNFFELNIKPTMTDDSDTINPDVIPNVNALREVLLSDSTEAVESMQKPFVIEHTFQEKSADTKFLLWRWLGLETSDRITATAPGGQKKSFLYWSDAKMSGKSYEDLASDVIAKALEQVTGAHSVVVETPGTSLPGRGIFGSSVSRRTAFESELAPPPSKNPIAESYVEIDYEWKGWEIDKNGLLKIIKQISDRFSFQFYPPNSLSTTTKVQLYSLQLKLSVYSAGIQALAATPVDKFKAILMRENKFIVGAGCPVGSRCPLSAEDAAQNRAEGALKQFKSSQKNYFAALGKGDANEASKQGLKMITSVEAIASAKGLVEMVGGQNNIYVQSTINGFRTNDEGGDSSIISDTLGQIGSTKRNGPLRFVQENLGMTDSEFFIYWILNKI